jgi:hypothetical protein
MFMVVGTVHGQTRTVAVGTPAEALAEIVRWCVADPDASGKWLLSPSSPDPVTVIARRRRGLVSESRRVSHLFQLLPGVSQGFHLIAHCGSPIPITELEWLDLHGRSGMPCMGCLQVLAQRLPELDEADGPVASALDTEAEEIADEVMPAAVHAHVIQSICG